MKIVDSNMSIQELNSSIDNLRLKRQELVRKIWNIESDIISLKEEKLRRFPKKYDDFEKV